MGALLTLALILGEVCVVWHAGALLLQLRARYNWHFNRVGGGVRLAAPKETSSGKTSPNPPHKWG